MRPTPANEALSAWLDGELDEAAIGELEAELARDPALREELEQLEAVVRTMRDEGPLTAPEGFEARVMARIAAEAPDEHGWTAWLRRPFGIPLEGWALGLAAAAVLLLLIPVWRGAPTDEADPQELSPAAVEPPSTKDPKGWDPPPVPSDPVTSEPPAGNGEADGAPEAAPSAKEGLGTSPDGVSKLGPGEKPGGKTTAPEPLPVPVPSSGEAAPEGTSSDAVVLGPEPHQLVVRSGSAGVKRDLFAVCARFFWTCTTPSGASDAKMRASRETVVVTLPQSDLPRLMQELSAMGHDVQRIGSDVLVKGSTVQVPVVLQLVGGSGEVEPRPPNAARSKQEISADEIVEEAK